MINKETMTNKEAKDVLQEQIDRYGQEYDAEGIEALEIAINVLEQQPCEDCISREAVIDLVADYDLNMDQVVKGIHALPPVTPKQKVGKWIVHPKGGYAHLVCSKCLSDAPFGCKTNYCPDCGAKMAESESDD